MLLSIELILLAVLLYGLKYKIIFTVNVIILVYSNLFKKRKSIVLFILLSSEYIVETIVLIHFYHYIINSFSYCSDLNKYQTLLLIIYIYIIKDYTL